MGSGARYQLRIGAGLLGRASSFPEIAGRSAVLVCDSSVARTHGAKLMRTLARVAERTAKIVVPGGEACKSWKCAQGLCENFAQLKLGRGDAAVAAGGGAVGDLCGFAAGIYMRGIDFVQVPTTLLAMVDASVGGKTGINMAAGKNLAGVFHQPAAVVADVDALHTLSAREFSSGMAEVVKHAVIDTSVLEFVKSRAGRLAPDSDAQVLAELVECNVRCKAAIVAADEKERSGFRAVLNLGHTFAHAIEAVLGYGKWLHGEAVAVGLVTAARLAERLGIAKLGLAGMVSGMLAELDLPVRWPALDRQKLHAAMTLDKKNSGGKRRLVLPACAGDVRVVENVAVADIDAVLDELSE